MVQLKLQSGRAYQDLKNIFHEQLQENGHIKLSGNHITLNGGNYYWKTNFPRDEGYVESAIIELAVNSFELLIDGRRRVIMNPQNIYQLWIHSSGIFGGQYFISWGDVEFKL